MMDMKTEDLIKLNVASNGRMIVGMLFALNLLTDHRALAFASVLIICAAYVSDVAFIVGRNVMASLTGLAVPAATVALGIVTWIAL